MVRLSDFKALTFDCYGTLIDWETGMLVGLRPLTSRLAEPLDDDVILQAHARHESSQQAQTPIKPYREILPIVYRRLAEEWGIPVSWADCFTYGASVKDWPAFADSVAALHYLKEHFRLVILSNVDNESFAASNDRLQVTFDAVYTAEDVGSYKPTEANFEYMLDKLRTIGIGRGDVLHTAESMFHDHAVANRLGLANCWIHRRHDREGFGATMTPDQPPTYDFQFNSMAELVTAHRAEQAEAIS